ncbi:MAG: hypothetical protein NTX68_17620 [Rhodococcus sp.]|nr:hypothetical protein [Rhodococcus sp. (in: high G+C Gram-positive bacteria)]
MTEPIHAVSPLATDIPAGLDVDSIVATVRESGVSAPAAEQDGLTAAVNRAEDHGIDLSIVIVPDEPRHDSQLRDLATAVGAREGGTVLVLSPGPGSHVHRKSRRRRRQLRRHTRRGPDSVGLADGWVGGDRRRGGRVDSRCEGPAIPRAVGHCRPARSAARRALT